VSLQNEYLSEATFKHVMQTAEHLKLGRIKKGWTNIMPEIVPINQGMNDLIVLHLEDDSQLQCLVDTKHIGSQVPNVLSKLVVLELIGMNKLESLFKGNVNLCNLKTVKIFECPRLVSVFHLSTSGSPPQLEELNIDKCEQLENIFTYERRVDDAIEEILVPKLKVVKIENCDKLTYIFDQEVKLGSLLELKLISVPNFIDIFPKFDNSIEGSSIPSNSISKPQTQLQLQVVEPIKSNIFSCCCYRSKTTKVPSQACSISTVTLYIFLFLCSLLMISFLNRSHMCFIFIGKLVKHTALLHL
jgi:hypothetical protein